MSSALLQALLQECEEMLRETRTRAQAPDIPWAIRRDKLLMQISIERRNLAEAKTKYPGYEGR